MILEVEISTLFCTLGRFSRFHPKLPITLINFISNPPKSTQNRTLQWLWFPSGNSQKKRTNRLNDHHSFVPNLTFYERAANISAYYWGLFSSRSACEVKQTHSRSARVFYVKYAGKKGQHVENLWSILQEWEEWELEIGGRAPWKSIRFHFQVEISIDFDPLCYWNFKVKVRKIMEIFITFVCVSLSIKISIEFHVSSGSTQNNFVSLTFLEN